MENITLGQVAAWAAFLIALVGGGIKIKKWIQEAIKATLKDELGDLKKDILSRRHRERPGVDRSGAAAFLRAIRSLHKGPRGKHLHKNRRRAIRERKENMEVNR